MKKSDFKQVFMKMSQEVKGDILHKFFGVKIENLLLNNAGNEDWSPLSKQIFKKMEELDNIQENEVFQQNFDIIFNNQKIDKKFNEIFDFYNEIENKVLAFFTNNKNLYTENNSLTTHFKKWKQNPDSRYFFENAKSILSEIFQINPVTSTEVQELIVLLYPCAKEHVGKNGEIKLPTKDELNARDILELYINDESAWFNKILELQEIINKEFNQLPKIKQKDGEKIEVVSDEAVIKTIFGMNLIALNKVLHQPPPNTLPMSRFQHDLWMSSKEVTKQTIISYGPKYLTNMIQALDMCPNIKIKENHFYEMIDDFFKAKKLHKGLTVLRLLCEFKEETGKSWSAEFKEELLDKLGKFSKLNISELYEINPVKNYGDYSEINTVWVRLNDLFEKYNELNDNQKIINDYNSSVSLKDLLAPEVKEHISFKISLENLEKVIAPRLTLEDLEYGRALLRDEKVYLDTFDLSVRTNKTELLISISKDVVNLNKENILEVFVEYFKHEGDVRSEQNGQNRLLRFNEETFWTLMRKKELQVDLERDNKQNVKKKPHNKV